MTIRQFSILLMVLGATLAVLGIAAPLLPSDAFLDQEQVEEFTSAAADYHATISVPYADRDSSSLTAAKKRFEAAKESIELARDRSAIVERVLRIGGLLVLLTGSVLHLGLSHSKQKAE